MDRDWSRDGDQDRDQDSDQDGDGDLDWDGDWVEEENLNFQGDQKDDHGRYKDLDQERDQDQNQDIYTQWYRLCPPQITCGTAVLKSTCAGYTGAGQC